MGAEFGMIKDENEDPSFPKNSGRGGKKLMERNMRTGAYYLRPRDLCSHRRSKGGRRYKNQKYIYIYKRIRQRRRDVKRETWRQGPRNDAAAVVSVFSSLLFMLFFHEREISPHTHFILTCIVCSLSADVDQIRQWHSSFPPEQRRYSGPKCRLRWSEAWLPLRHSVSQSGTAREGA